MPSNPGLSPRRLRFLQAALLATVVSAFACGEDPEKTPDAGGDLDNVPSIDIPPIECWGAAWKCTDGGLPDGGDVRAPTVFHADLSEAQVVPARETRELETSANLTLSGDQTVVSLGLASTPVANPRVFLRRGSPGAAAVETIGEFNLSKLEPLPVTPAQVAALFRGDVFLELVALGDPMVRGQVLGRDEVLYTAKLTGNEAATPNASADHVTVHFVHDTRTDTYRYWMPASQRTVLPKSLELDIVGGAKFDDLDVTKDGDPGGSTDPKAGFGSGLFNSSEKPSAPLANGKLVVKAVLPGNDAVELVGTLLIPGSRIYEASLDGLQLPTKVSTPHKGSVRFMVNHSGTKLTYDIKTDAIPSEVSVRRVAQDTATTEAMFMFSPQATSSGRVSVGISTAEMMSPDALKAIETGRAFLFVRSKEKNLDDTEKYPNGELGGAIRKPGETLFVADVASTLNPGTAGSAGNGVAWVYASPDRSRVRYVVSTAGLPLGWAALDLAVARDDVSFDSTHLNSEIVAAGVRSEIAGSLAFDSGSRFPLAVDNGWLRVRAGLSGQTTSTIAGHFLQPGEFIYVAKLVGEGVSPRPVVSPTSSLAMAVITADATNAKLSVALRGSTGAIRVCKGLAGAEGTGCTQLKAPTASLLPYTEKIAYDAAGFERGSWFVQTEDLTQYVWQRGPFVRPDESVFYSYLIGGKVTPMPATGYSTAYGQLVFIANASRTEVRFDGTFHGAAGSVATPAALQVMQAQDGQPVPEFPNQPVTIQSVTGSSVSGKLTTMGVSFVVALEAGTQSLLLVPGDGSYEKGQIRGAIARK